MPRRARIALPGVAWHIIQRGNNRTPCFYDSGDYRRYLDLLTEHARGHGCAVHAYVLMTNHVHLLLTPERRESASLLMKHLGQCYVQYVNRTYGRTGTLWEGRFRSCLTQTADYVLSCYRYIELNPVRAGMVEHPAGYPWSSFHANGGGATDATITPHIEYQALGSSVSIRQRAYRALFRIHLDPKRIGQIRAATNGNYALGNDRFNKEIAATLGRRVTPATPGRPRKRRQ